MNRATFVREMAEEMEMPRRQVAEILESMLAHITKALKSGDKVQLAPFGQFKVRNRAARIGRNPMTGQPIKIPAKKVLKFLPAKALKEAVGTAKRRTKMTTRVVKTKKRIAPPKRRIAARR